MNRNKLKNLVTEVVMEFLSNNPTTKPAPTKPATPSPAPVRRPLTPPSTAPKPKPKAEMELANKIAKRFLDLSGEEGLNEIKINKNNPYKPETYKWYIYNFFRDKGKAIAISELSDYLDSIEKPSSGIGFSQAIKDMLDKGFINKQGRGIYSINNAENVSDKEQSSMRKNVSLKNLNKKISQLEHSLNTLEEYRDNLTPELQKMWGELSQIPRNTPGNIKKSKEISKKYGYTDEDYYNHVFSIWWNSQKLPEIQSDLQKAKNRLEKLQ